MEDGNKWAVLTRTGSWQCSPKDNGARTCAGQGTYKMKRVHETTTFAEDSDFFNVVKTKVKGSRKPPCTKSPRIKWEMHLPM